MATLYRKYRPRNFEETVGQNHIKITLANQVQTDNFAHAYLFCGPRAVGKTTLARIFAKSINCLNRQSGESEPCDECESCEEIGQGRSLDIVEIDAASNTGVDNVRENIIATAKVAPSNRKFKVFIIDEVHMLSVSAFNALLKTLEEPPSNVVFILCTTEVHKMPNTIISRCQRFDFKKIGVKDISDKLDHIAEQEGIKVDKEILNSIARHSEGHMRDAESLLGQIVAVSGKEITQKEADLVIPRSDINEIINLIEFLAQKDSAGGIALVNKLVDNGVDLRAFLSDFIEILRKIMISKIDSSLAEKLSLELGESLEIRVNEVAQKLSLQQLVEYLEKFMSVRDAVKHSFIIQLPVELALVELCEKREQPSRDNSTPPPASSSSEQSQETSTGNENIAAGTEENSSPSSAGAYKSSDVDLKEVCSRWHEVLAKVKKYNHSLSFILKVCQVQNIKEGTMSLAFKYKFHKDRLTDDRIRQLVEKTLQEVFGHSFTIEPVVDENLEIEESPQSAAEEGSAEAPASEENSSQEGDQNQEGGSEHNGEDQDDQDNFMDNILKTFGGKVIK